MRITLLIEQSGNRAIPFDAGEERYSRLAEVLSYEFGEEVPIEQGILLDAPRDSYLLFASSGDVSRSLADCGPTLAAHLAPRIVLLDVSWQMALQTLETHRLAGALDSLRLSEWLARPSSGTGPFGLHILANKLGATCVPLPWFRSTHYGLLQSHHPRGMPYLLASYLTAYDLLELDQQIAQSAARITADSHSLRVESGMMVHGHCRPRRRPQWDLDNRSVSSARHVYASV